MAGNLVVNLAAVIAGIVLVQLAYPSGPVFMAGAPSVMDLKTGGSPAAAPRTTSWLPPPRKWRTTTASP